MQARERELLMALGVGIAALACLLALFRWVPLTSTNEGLDIDGVWYGAIARSPAKVLDPPPIDLNQAQLAATDPSLWTIDELTHWAPFCWRLLTPILVHLTGMAPVAGFLQVNLVGQWLAAMLLWALLRKLNVEPLLAGAGIALYLLSFWGPGFAFWSPAHTETVTMVLTLALLLSIVADQRWATAILFVLGSLQREQLLTLALFQALWLWKRKGMTAPRALGLAVLIVLPGAAVQTLLRLLIEPLNRHDLLPSILFYSGQRWRHVVESRGLYLVRFAAGTLHALGAVVLLIIAGGPRLWRALGREWPWLAMAAVTWMFVFTGGVDNERRSFYAFPMLLAPLLLRWNESPLSRSTIAVLACALIGHAVLNWVLIDLSSPEMYGRTAISVFLPHADLPGYLLRVGGVSAATLLVCAIAIHSRGRRANANLSSSPSS